VLFADLVGFTGLSEDKDPELLKHLIDRCFERLVADITSFGGTVDKIVGDAVVALFGAPIAHEDDPERAVRAALRMQRSLADLRTDGEVEIKMRIGITTGEVLVGAISAGGDYTAMGDTVNLASRLESMAAPGEVLVGPATQSLTASAIEYEAKGLVEIRGRDNIEAFVAVSELLPPGRRRRGFLAPMVGRQAEQLHLTTAIETSVARDRAHLVLLLGEAGMGKSRLAEEVSASIEESHDALILEGRALPYGETNPYNPIAEAMATAFEIGPGESDVSAEQRISRSVAALFESSPDDDAIHRVTKVVLHIMSYETGLDLLEPTRRREEIQIGLRTLLEAVTDRRPVILSLGDINWANDLLLSLLESLITALAKKPFVLLTTARWAIDEERWVIPPGRHNTTVLNLDALDRDSSAELVRSLFDVEISEELTDALFERSGGNPFFLEELSALLKQAGTDAGSRSELAERLGELPDTLRGLVAARLDGLNTTERAMVDDASVIGRSGPVYGLMTMAEYRGADGVESVFRQLVAKDIFGTEHDRWRFKSDLVRDIAYNTLTKTARAQRHIAIGQWLVAHRKDEDRAVRAGFVARHFAAVAALSTELGPIDGVPDNIIDLALLWLAEAAKDAAASASYLVAAKFFAQAIELLDDDDARLVDVSLGRARARLGLREIEGALDDADTARRVAFVTGNQPGIADAIMVRGEIETAKSEFVEARTHLSSAIKRWRDLGNDAGTAEALRLYGMAARHAGDAALADSNLTEALEIFRNLGDTTGEAWCQQNLAWVAFETGNTAEARIRLDRAIEVFRHNEDAGGLGWALGLAAFLNFHEGDSETALKVATKVHEEAVRRGDRFGAPMMRLLMASVSLWRGQCRESVEHCQAAIRVFRETDSEFGLIQTFGTLVRAHAALGQFAELRHALAEATEAAASEDGMPNLDFVRMVEGSAATQTGDADRALAILETFDQHGRDHHMLGDTDRQVTRALALLQLGRVEEAIEVVKRVTPKDPNDPASYFSSTMALLEVTRGNVDEASKFARIALDSPRSTYLDIRSAQLAIALGHARLGRNEQMETAFDDAEERIDETDSRLSQTVVRLARAIAYEAVGHPEAVDRRARATRALESLGIPLTGWAELFVSAVEPRANVQSV